jgi:hypothetical protein
MGLDQWLSGKEEGFIFEWRKRYLLSEYMGELFFKQNPELSQSHEDPFNGGITFVYEENVDEIISLIEAGEWDDDFYNPFDADYKEENLNMWKNVKDKLINGDRIHYTCSY